MKPCPGADSKHLDFAAPLVEEHRFYWYILIIWFTSLYFKKHYPFHKVSERGPFPAGGHSTLVELRILPFVHLYLTKN